MNPLVKMMLAAVNTGDPAALVAHRFGVRASEVEDLRRWPTDKRQTVIEWLLREDEHVEAS